MARAGDILVSESSLGSGTAQQHLLNIIGTGGGDVYIVQAPESWIADIRGINAQIEMNVLEPVVDFETLKVEVELEEELNI